MIEPYYYRFSNFQNWLRSTDDPFVYRFTTWTSFILSPGSTVEVSVSGAGQVPEGRKLHVGQRPGALREWGTCR